MKKFIKNFRQCEDSAKFNSIDKNFLSIKVFAIENLADLIDENFLIFMRKSLHKFFKHASEYNLKLSSFTQV